MTNIQQLITEVKALPEMQTVVPESRKMPKETMFDICKDENGQEILAVSEAYGGEIVGEEYKFSELRQQFYSKTYPVISPEEIKAAIQRNLGAFHWQVSEQLKTLTNPGKYDFASELVIEKMDGTMSKPPQNLLDNEDIIYIDDLPLLKVEANGIVEACDKVEMIFEKYGYDTGFPISMLVGELSEDGSIVVDF